MGGPTSQREYLIWLKGLVYWFERYAGDTNSDFRVLSKSKNESYEDE